MQVEVLWQQFLSHGNQEDRHQLILHYLPLVKHIAGRMAVKAHPLLSHDDLENCGVIGLMEAIDKFDPNLGVTFEAYSYQRIRGAMLDEIRRQNWLPRAAWKRVQSLKTAREKLEMKLGRQVTGEDLANELSITVSEVNQLLACTNKAYILSLDEEISGQDGNHLKKSDTMEDINSPDPLHIIEDHESRKLLVEALEKLNERDRLMLSLYYQEGLTLKEIGLVLEISESRVCQLHSKAMDRLRKLLKHY